MLCYGKKKYKEQRVKSEDLLEDLCLLQEKREEDQDFQEEMKTQKLGKDAYLFINHTREDLPHYGNELQD